MHIFLFKFSSLVVNGNFQRELYFTVLKIARKATTSSCMNMFPAELASNSDWGRRETAALLTVIRGQQLVMSGLGP